MYKRILINFTLFVFIFSATVAYAQRNIGKVEEDLQNVNESLLDIPVEHWIGKEFLFPERPKGLQKYGYKVSLKKELYSRCIPNPEFENNTTCWLKYDKFVGKTIKVIGFEKLFNTETLVVFLEEESIIEK